MNSRIRIVGLLIAALLVPAPLVLAQEASPAAVEGIGPISLSAVGMTAEEMIATRHNPLMGHDFQPLNVLRVSAPTGAILEWVDNGHATTEIEIRGVTPDTDGFQLYNPHGVWTFRDKMSTPGGTVVFHNQDLVPGIWIVTRSGAEATEVDVTTFTPPPRVAEQLLGASYSTAPGSGGDARRYNYNCGWTNTVSGYQTKEVPLAILHAPYGGSSTHTQDYTSTQTYVFGPYSTSSTGTTGFSLDATDGKTWGQFRDTRWVEYYTWYSCDYNSPRYYKTNIDWWYGSHRALGVWGSSQRTDGDDAFQAGNSVYFNHRFHYQRASYDQSQAPGSLTLSVSRSDVTTFTAGIVFENRWYDFNVRATATNGGTTKYQYTFPGGTPLTYVDNVRESGQSLAFCTYTPSLGIDCHY